MIQHPRERLHPIGTARFAALSLAQVQVEVAWDAGAVEHEPPTWLPADAALLYPGPEARDLGALPEGERPKHLVVLDGTWHTARTLYRDKAWLKRLPHYRFSPAEPSHYRLRREPERDCVSTIEAIVEALRLLEPETRGLDALLRAFDTMIDDQLEYVGRKAGAPRTRKKRPLAERRIPRALVHDFEQVVVAYVESFRKQDDAARELVQVAAVALGSGEVFERMLRPSIGIPTAVFLEHMQLSAADVDAGQELSAFRADFARFLAGAGCPTRLAAWNQSTLDLLGKALGEEPSQLSLKGAYRALHGVAARDLAAAVAAQGLSPAPLPLRGRAAGRLAGAVAIAHRLHACALGEPRARADTLSDSLRPVD